MSNTPHPLPNLSENLAAVTFLQDWIEADPWFAERLEVHCRPRDPDETTQQYIEALNASVSTPVRITVTHDSGADFEHMLPAWIVVDALNARGQETAARTIYEIGIAARESYIEGHAAGEDDASDKLADFVQRLLGVPELTATLRGIRSAIETSNVLRGQQLGVDLLRE